MILFRQAVMASPSPTTWACKHLSLPRALLQANSSNSPLPS